MPLDDLTLGLSPAPAVADEVELMTRVLRLPTASRREALAIVRLQLDRLSPIPAADALFDLVFLRRDGSEGVFALGLVRRSAVAHGATSGMLSVRRMVDGVEAVFRFKSPTPASQNREAERLKHAPRIALACLGAASVALAAHGRADAWRTERLEALAAEKVALARAERQAQDMVSARAEWRKLERVDAASRYLCVLSRVAAANRQPVAIVSVAADPERVSFRVSRADSAAALTAAGGSPLATAGEGDGRDIEFGGELCG